MTLYSRYGGENCLQMVDTKVIDVLIAELGDDVLYFVTPAYAERAQSVYDNLHISKLTLQNVWVVFSKMLSRM